MAGNKESGCVKIIGIGAGLATIFGAAIALFAWLFPFESMPSIIADSSYSTSPAPTVCVWSFEKARITSLKFYEGGKENVVFEDRVYATEFSSETARYIFLEISLHNECPAKQKEGFVIDVAYYNPDGTIKGQYASNATIDIGWQDSHHSSGWGRNEPGSWKTGRYKVVINIPGFTEITGSFVIDP